MSISDDTEALTAAVKASVIGSGALASLGNVKHDAPPPPESDLHDLKQQALAMVEDVQQLLDGGRLDGDLSQKLASVLNRLKGALATNNISRAALTMALSEAVTAVSAAEGGGQSLTQQQIVEKLWQQVEADNKDIDDDFEKMRKAGVVFGEKLWNRHKELMEYLKDHPHDIKAQKELDAVDDTMLVQAEAQTAQHPGAKEPFEDAKKKSKDRHQAVDRDLAEIDKNTSINNSVSMADFDESPKSANDKLTMTDLASPLVGQKPKPTSRQMG